MAELWIGLQRQYLLQTFDSLRDFPKPLGVASWISPAFFVGDDVEAFAKGDGELG